MELILHEDVPHLGKAGDIVKVRDGYGRNYLLPQKKAVLANRANVKELEHHKRVIARKIAKRIQEGQALKTDLEKLSLVFEREAGQEDKLFGSVTSHDILVAIEALGHRIDKKMLQLEEPIKALGDFEVPLKLLTDVVAVLKISVVKKKA